MDVLFQLVQAAFKGAKGPTDVPTPPRIIWNDLEIRESAFSSPDFSSSISTYSWRSRGGERVSVVAFPAAHLGRMQQQRVKSAFYEAVHLGHLQHQHILRVHGVTEERTSRFRLAGPGRFALVTGEFQSTLAAADSLRNELIPLRLQFVSQIASALAYAHSEGVVHGGLSRACVLRTSCMEVKLAGPWAARLLTRTAPSDCSSLPGLGVSAVLQTAGCNAADLHTMQAADVLAFSALAWELLKAQPLYEQCASGLQFVQEVSCASDPLGWLPSGVARLLKQCEACNPLARPSAKTVYEEMKILAALAASAAVKISAAAKNPHALLAILRGELGREPFVCAAVCSALAALTSRPSRHADRSKAFIQEGVATLVATLLEHGRVVAVATSACLVISNVAGLKDGKEAAVDARAPAALVDLLTLHNSVSCVAISVCRALAHISSLEAGALAACYSCAPWAIVNALRGQRDNIDLAEFACRALARITSHVGGKLSALTAGVPAVLSEVLTAHKGKEYIVLPALQALHNVGTIDAGAAAVRELLGDLKTTLVTALTSCSGALKVPDYACRILINAAQSHAGRDAMILAGLPAAIIATLIIDRNIAATLEHACLALYNISFSAAGRRSILVAGAAPALVAALHRRPGTTRLVLSAVRALARLSEGEDCGRAVVAAGGPAAIVAAMTAHLDNCVIAEHACSALCKQTAFHAGRESSCLAGAPAALVAILNAHQHHEGVTSRACRALANIACLERGRVLAALADAPAALVAALDGSYFAARPAVAEAACRALGNIALHESGELAAVAAGAPAAIVKVLAVHEDNAVVVENACWALASVIARVGKDAAIDSGAPGVVVAALRKHAGNNTVSMYGRRGLESIVLRVAAWSMSDGASPSAITAEHRAAWRAFSADKRDHAEDALVCVAFSTIVRLAFNSVAMLYRGRLGICEAGGADLLPEEIVEYGESQSSTASRPPANAVFSGCYCQGVSADASQCETALPARQQLSLKSEAEAPATPVCAWGDTTGTSTGSATPAEPLCAWGAATTGSTTPAEPVCAWDATTGSTARAYY